MVGMTYRACLSLAVHEYNGILMFSSPMWNELFDIHLVHEGMVACTILRHYQHRWNFDEKSPTLLLHLHSDRRHRSTVAVQKLLVRSEDSQAMGQMSAGSKSHSLKGRKQLLYPRSRHTSRRPMRFYTDLRSKSKGARIWVGGEREIVINTHGIGQRNQE